MPYDLRRQQSHRLLSRKYLSDAQSGIKDEMIWCLKSTKYQYNKPIAQSHIRLSVNRMCRLMEKRYSINSPKMTRKYYPNAQKFVVSHKDWKERKKQCQSQKWFHLWRIWNGNSRRRVDCVCLSIIVIESMLFGMRQMLDKAKCKSQWKSSVYI